METEFTLEDIDGDTISFRIADGTDMVEISTQSSALMPLHSAAGCQSA